jgi:hypothetical protein
MQRSNFEMAKSGSFGKTLGLSSECWSESWTNRHQTVRNRTSVVRLSHSADQLEEPKFKDEGKSLLAMKRCSETLLKWTCEANSVSKPFFYSTADVIAFFWRKESSNRLQIVGRQPCFDRKPTERYQVST